MDDAAESELEGDVLAKVSGGVARYRIWPAMRHPVRSALISLVVLTAIVGTAVWLGGLYWALIVGIGLTMAAAPFFFPTEVTLDGHQLNIRRLGTVRVWDLRMFQRIEVSREPMPRVELLKGPRLSPMAPIDGVSVPLPSQSDVEDAVIRQMRRWIGRRPTGTFKLDSDYVPEDSVDDDGL